MKKIELELTYYDMFLLACTQLGRFFADDSTAEERIAHLDNIHILKAGMDEKHLKGFMDVSKQFEPKIEELKTKGDEAFKRFGEELKAILGNDNKWKMENEIKDVWTHAFIKDENLVKFANEFSSKYKLLSEGVYRSDDNKYVIDYRNDFKVPFKGYARVSLTFGSINLNRKELLFDGDVSENFVFYLILWCAVEKEIRNYVQTDIITLNYYLENKKPLKDLALYVLPMIKMNKERFNTLKDFIDKFENDNKKNNDEKN